MSERGILALIGGGGVGAALALLWLVVYGAPEDDLDLLLFFFSLVIALFSFFTLFFRIIFSALPVRKPSPHPLGSSLQQGAVWSIPLVLAAMLRSARSLDLVTAALLIALFLLAQLTFWVRGIKS